ncbi:MAG: hypothetical protein ACI9SE_002243 [Neolewinella sp.]|jgi:hypothetical protein
MAAARTAKPPCHGCFVVRRCTVFLYGTRNRVAERPAAASYRPSQQREAARYENFVMPGIEISLFGASSCHVSRFGINTSVLSCASFQVTRLPV